LILHTVSLDTAFAIRKCDASSRFDDRRQTA
jgi:hypothetical protein